MKGELTEAQWKDAESLLKMSREEIAEKMNAMKDKPVQFEINTDDGEPVSVNSDKPAEVKFEIGFFKIIALKGLIKFTPGENWSVKIQLSAYLLGNEVRKQTMTLDKHHYEECTKVDLGLAYYQLCFGVRDAKICVYLTGEIGAYLIWKGWVEEKFNENIVCFK